MWLALWESRSRSSRNCHMTEGWTSREISSSWCCSTRPIEHHSRAGNSFRQSCIYYDLQLEYSVICRCKYILLPAIKTFVSTNIWLTWVKNEFKPFLCAEMQFYIIYKRIRIHIPHMINLRWEIFHPKPERQDALSHSKIFWKLVTRDLIINFLLCNFVSYSVLLRK